MTTTTENNTDLVKQSSASPEQALELALNSKYLEDLQAALPQGMDSESWIRAMVGILKARPDVMKCDKQSIILAVFDAARTGIDPSSGGAEMFYFLPVGGQVSFTLSYKGSIALAKRNGALLDMYARSIRAGDEWEWTQGGAENITHTPSLDPERETREITHVYAVAVLPSSTEWCGPLTLYECWSRARINAHIIKHVKNANSAKSPWKADFEAMAHKTVIKSYFTKGRIPTIPPNNKTWKYK